MTIAPGFADTVLGAQTVFRGVMDAIARPGRVRQVAGLSRAPKPLTPVAAAIALTLADYDTPVFLDAPLAASDDVTAWLRFHTGATVTNDTARAAFAFVADPAAAPPFNEFGQGTPEYPDRSTTIVLQVETFSGGIPLMLTGPGIKGSTRFSAAPLPTDFAARLIANRALFPRGVDLLLAGPEVVAALPRSVRVSGG
jgi:alpha-D-ribose 1-methylphosphonate 5-triphosphate synthase subunit PhnH